MPHVTVYRETLDTAVLSGYIAATRVDGTEWRIDLNLDGSPSLYWPTCNGGGPIGEPVRLAR